MKKCLVIYNPHSGKGVKQEQLTQIFNILKKHNYESDLKKTKYCQHAKEIIKEADFYDLVISLGGDGTFNEVLSGNLERKKQLVLAHIPLGTTNDIGAMFGLNKNIIRNLKLILEGTIKKIDVCSINNTPFMYVAGCGKFMNVPYETPRKLKKRFGYLAYAYEAIKTILNKINLFDISYTIDGVTYNGLYSFIVISNASRIAGIDDIYEDVLLDDDKFEVLFCNLTNKKDIIKSLYYAKTSTNIAKVPGFYFVKTDNLKIRFKNNYVPNWCIDGERLDNERKVYDIDINKRVEMMIPKTKITKLFKNK